MDQITNYIEDYKRNISLYQSLVEEIKYTIDQQCKGIGLKYADLKSRVKSIESAEEKLKRKFKDGSEEKIELRDLAGLRIVCLFEEEKIKFTNLIESVFKIDYKDDKKTFLGANQMGYQSIHFIVGLGNNFVGPRYQNIKSLVAEIQITTVLQEAWNQISHTLVYKNNSAPLDIQRDINNVSALLEIAQKVFNDSHMKRDMYINEISQTANDLSALFSQPINFDTLSLFSKKLFPGMEISEKWQNELINDIDKTRYQELRDINTALIHSKGFIDYYMRIQPGMFRYSTDILTKSLGFYDREFRKKHDFSQYTRGMMNQFDKRES